MEEESGPVWDCRWPDPVALKVSATRILRNLPEKSPELNRNLAITVEMELNDDYSGDVRALLVTPWAVERIYWHSPTRGNDPPIRHAMALEADGAGRVAAGQGVLLELEDRQLVPVVTAWEPETGHYFVETLLHHTQGFDTAQSALDRALGKPLTRPTRQSVSSTMQRNVSRRGLLKFWNS
ncbi:MAG: hypothetical protein G8237_04190 [Magnetococcales bacterium]|nr:hypothetical protein [Magnetococcales bacterium]NGZ05534.1 hypothetical protein [Magnetococcales bacterium]